MDFLNNREIATVIWLTVFFAWTLSNEDVRASFITLIHVFLEKRILILLSFLTLYNVIIIYALHTLGLWNSDHIKNTLVWFVTVAIASFFRLPTIENDQDYFKKTLIDNVKIVVFLEFLFTFYTFNLFIELLFVPLIALLSALLAVSQLNEKHLLVEKLLNNILKFIGLIIIAYTFYKLITAYDEFMKKQTFLDFITPILLSLFLLPFVYTLHIYVVYEKILTIISIRLKDKKLFEYAKRTAILKYRLNITALKKWADMLTHMRIENSSDIDESHNEMNRLCLEEKSPPIIPFKQGWSPYSANAILTEQGLRTGYYQKSYDDIWRASSPYLNISGRMLKNNIIYYLEGNKNAVTSLTLELNIYEIEQSAEAHKKLLECASKLYCYAFGNELGKIYKNAILKTKNEKQCIKSKIVKVAINYWPNKKGYDVIFSIENINHFDELKV